MPYTQENRILELQTPLGVDKLMLRAMRGREGISQLFHFDLDLISELDHAIKFDAILGQRVVIAVRPQNAEARFINGFVSNFSQSGGVGGFAHYQMEVVPWLWFLSRTADCRIFQKMSVPDIIEKIFRELGFADFKLDLHGTYEPREYCVQYRETDLNFVSRLMEEYGIFYFFTHDEEKHTLVLADSSAAYKPVPQQSKVRYSVRTVVAESEDEGIVTSWNLRQEVRPGAYALKDYNFEIPRVSLSAHVPSKVSLERSKNLEIYDYPGEYLKAAEGESLAKIRIEQEETFGVVAQGSGDCRAFLPGYWFTLSEHEREDMNGKYVLTEVHHTGSSAGSYRTGTDGSGDNHYSNAFTCIPYDTLFRPPRVTPQPLVQGPQTAVVVGPSGEEIYTDKYGRIKVQFHWDREGQQNEQSSCWMRVAQPWAGKGWGAMVIPRIGQEVVVEFLEGDPDQPIITGCVYNAEQVPPYPLPDDKTRSTFKTSSSKGGVGFNEIRFEDLKGKEQVFVHAERNLDFRTKKDRFENVGEESHRKVGKDSFAEVGGDHHYTVKGDQNEKIGGTLSITAGQDLHAKVGSTCAVAAGSEIHLKGGMTVVVEAGVSLTLKVGGNFVNINPAGVFISGTMVMINSGGAAGSGSGCNAHPPTAPKDADDAKGGTKVEPAKPEPARKKQAGANPAAVALRTAAPPGTPFCKVCQQK